MDIPQSKFQLKCRCRPSGVVIPLEEYNYFGEIASDHLRICTCICAMHVYTNILVSLMMMQMYAFYFGRSSVITTD